jgi:hypothetical protein
MKILKKILLVVLIIIAIPFIIALFVKNEYSVEQEQVINKPKAEVFDYVKLLKNQDKYNKWVMMDPKVRREYKGTDGTVGFITTWDSDEVGKGAQEITKIAEGDRIDSELRFEEPMKSTGSTYMTTEAITPTQTKVKWVMHGTSSYPMNFMNLFVPAMLGKDLQTSLTTLKGVLEKS